MKAKKPMVEGNMGKFKNQIVYSNPKENFLLNTCILLRSCYNVIKNNKKNLQIPDPLVSLALLRDEQRLSSGKFVDDSQHSS